MGLRGDSRYRRHHSWQRAFPPEAYRDFYDRLHTVIAPETKRLVSDGNVADRDEPSVTHRAVLLALYAHHARATHHGTDLRLGFSVALPVSYRACILIVAASGTSMRASAADRMLEQWRAQEGARQAERDRQNQLDELLYDPTREPSPEPPRKDRERRPGAERQTAQQAFTQPPNVQQQDSPETAAEEAEESEAKAESEATAFLLSYSSELGHTTAMHLATALAELGKLDETHMVAAEAAYADRAEKARRTGRWPNAREVVTALFQA